MSEFEVFSKEELSDIAERHNNALLDLLEKYGKDILETKAENIKLREKMTVLESEINRAHSRISNINFSKDSRDLI